MRHLFLSATAAGFLLSGICSAQTGVLAPDASGRRLPPLSGRMVLANQYTRQQTSQQQAGAAYADSPRELGRILD